MKCTDMGNGVYRIGSGEPKRPYPSYSYLILSGSSGGIVDPGPRDRFTAMLPLLNSLLPIEKLSFLIITSEISDACSSLPLWAKSGFLGKVIIHNKASLSARYSEWKGAFSIVHTGKSRVRFGRNRELLLLNIPGLPTAGSLCCFDPQSGSLFSGMLFGSYGPVTAVADEESLDRIISFHDQFGLSNAIGPFFHTILEELKPTRILPRNGPPVRETLRKLAVMYGDLTRECPDDADPKHAYDQIIAEANRRLADVFPEDEVRGVLERMDPPALRSMTPRLESEAAEQVFNHYFNEIRSRKGTLWLSIIKSMVQRGVDSAGKSLPAVFTRYETEIDQGIVKMVLERTHLKAQIFELQKSMIEASDEQLKDPVTGLYNEAFFEEYLSSAIPATDKNELPNISFVFIRLDGIVQLNQQYGSKAGDSTLQGLANFLMNMKRENGVFFRMNGPLFACPLQDADKEQAVEYAGLIRDAVQESDQFIEKISISAAVVVLTEITHAYLETERFYSSLMKIAKERIKLLNRMGPGSICSKSNITLHHSSGTILLIEHDPFEADLFRRILEREGFETHPVTNGNKAIEQADLYRPDVIISEIFIAQMDGFQIRKRMLESPDLKNVPYIIISRDKSDASVQRAHELGIKHFFRKPVMATEIAGVIRLLIRESAGEHHS